MSFVLSPWHLLLVTLVGMAQRENQRKIEILKSQLMICKQFCGKRILLTDAQRRVLAVQAKTLSRRALEEVFCLFSPDTALRWHRELVAQKWDYSKKRKSPGRPKVAKEVQELVLRMAKENPSWGYDRIQSALANLGHEVSDTTVGNILKAHGIEPAPERKHKTTWKTFIRAHWDVLSSIDFTTVEVWTKWGLATFYLLFVMELKTRRVHLAGITMNPDGPWMRQVARNLTAFDDGALNGKKYLLMDRDTKFCEAFRGIIENAGTECMLLPPRSPNLNANLERFMGSIKREMLHKMIFFGEASLRKATFSYLEQPPDHLFLSLRERPGERRERSGEGLQV